MNRNLCKHDQGNMAHNHFHLVHLFCGGSRQSPQKPMLGLKPVKITAVCLMLPSLLADKFRLLLTPDCSLQGANQGYIGVICQKAATFSSQVH